MESLLSLIVMWLSINFDLPADHRHPRIEFVAPSQIISLRYRGLLSQNTQMQEASGQGRDVVSVYDDKNKTIYLPIEWSGQNPGELSVLVHEMVHHLQTAARLKFACPQEREKAAYLAQQRWLEAFGTNLEREFQLDAMSVLVMTQCAY